jgi:GntR family transcriptional regulator, rspAB operon transcriptional repressor
VSVVALPGSSLREQVYQQLKSDIILGVYRPGEKLEVARLIAQHGLSKTPVRDALHALQQEGLVEVLPRVGYFASRITIKDVEDIFQLRLIVETASAELAAPRIADEDLLDLERLTQRRYVAGHLASYKEFLADNREFHHRVAVASGNVRLADVVQNLLNQMQRLLILRLDLRDNADEMLAEHQRLLQAFRSRDSKAARQAMEDALRNARDAVMQSIVSRGKDWSL